MFRAIRKLFRQMRCKRHRWRPDRRYDGTREFCDLCGAKRETPAK